MHLPLDAIKMNVNGTKSEHSFLVKHFRITLDRNYGFVS